MKLITDEPRTAAGDSTGFETHHTSRYFIHRCQRGEKDRENPHDQTTTYRRFPKLGVNFDVATHLALSLVTGVGPSDDHSHGEALIVQAWKRVDIDTALFDAGYDSEGFHRLMRHDMGIRSIIPAKIGRPTARPPTGRYRAEMKSNFPKEIYNQRWQAETGFSMIKRRQGECVQAIAPCAQNRAMALKVLTHNVMILRRHRRGFLQSRTGTFYRPVLKPVSSVLKRTCPVVLPCPVPFSCPGLCQPRRRG